METGARSYGIWNCLHVCTSQSSVVEKSKKTQPTIFFLQNWRVCPQRKVAPACWVLWRPQCGSNFAGHLLAPPWSLEQDPRAFGTAYMGALVISVQKKSENPTDKFFSFKTGGFAPRENWQQLVGCFGGPNAAQILQVTSLHLHGAWSKSLGHLELPTWVH